MNEILTIVLALGLFSSFANENVQKDIDEKLAQNIEASADTQIREILHGQSLENFYQIEHQFQSEKKIRTTAINKENDQMLLTCDSEITNPSESAAETYCQIED